MTSPAIAKDVEKLLGEVDPQTIERILDTRATADEIAEALADLEDDHLGERLEPVPERIAAVREILLELREDEDDTYLS